MQLLIGFFRLNFEDENYPGFVFLYSICRIYLKHWLDSGNIGSLLTRKRKIRNAVFMPDAAECMQVVASDEI